MVETANPASYNEWVHTLERVALFERKAPWDMADLIVMGVEQFGQSISSLVELIPYSHATIKTYLSIGKKFRKATRPDDPQGYATFSHYRQVAAIMPVNPALAMNLIKEFLQAWYTAPEGYYIDNPNDPASAYPADWKHFKAKVDSVKLELGIKDPPKATSPSGFHGVRRGDVLHVLGSLATIADQFDYEPETILEQDDDSTFYVKVIVVVEEADDD